MARRVRPRALPVSEGRASRVPRGGGPRDEGLPTEGARSDQDEAHHGLVVDPETHRLRWPRSQALDAREWVAVAESGGVRIAVIGAGHWGPNLIRNFHNHPRSSVTWVVDTNPQRLAQVAERYPDVATTNDASQALAAGDVDAVVVASPTTMHHALAKEALGRG